MHKRQPFNQRTKTMVLQVTPNTQDVPFPGERDLHIELEWSGGKVVKAEIRNDEFDFIGDWLGKIEVTR